MLKYFKMLFHAIMLMILFQLHCNKTFEMFAKEQKLLGVLGMNIRLSFVYDSSSLLPNKNVFFFSRQSVNDKKQKQLKLTATLKSELDPPPPSRVSGVWNFLFTSKIFITSNNLVY